MDEFFAGVTRQAMLNCAFDLGIDVSEKPLDQNLAFDELYLCSTLKELAPIAWLNDRAIGGGPIGSALLTCFHSGLH